MTMMAIAQPGKLAPLDVFCGKTIDLVVDTSLVRDVVGDIVVSVAFIEPPSIVVDESVAGGTGVCVASDVIVLPVVDDVAVVVVVVVDGIRVVVVVVVVVTSRVPVRIADVISPRPLAASDGVIERTALTSVSACIEPVSLTLCEINM